jgi:hypothetical protein
VPSSRDLASLAPALYLLQQGTADAAEDDSSSSGSEDSESEPASGDEEEAAVSGSSSGLLRHWLAHTKPRNGSPAQVLLRLRALSGSDLRDSQQVIPNTAAGGPGQTVACCFNRAARTAWALPTTAAAAALFALLPPQKCALQAGVPIEASALLAQHTVEEAKRYSTNCTYELCDTTAAALKLVRAHLVRTASFAAPRATH